MWMMTPSVTPDDLPASLFVSRTSVPKSLSMWNFPCASRQGMETAHPLAGVCASRSCRDEDSRNLTYAWVFPGLILGFRL